MGRFSVYPFACTCNSGSASRPPEIGFSLKWLGFYSCKPCAIGGSTRVSHTGRKSQAAIPALIGALIGVEFDAIQSGPARKASTPIRAGDDLDLWEERLEKVVETDQKIPETDREAIIRARRGQRVFKQRVSQIERMCRITKVENPVHLVASHINPWRDSTNEERLGGENGLLLTPTIDHLLDRGFICFENSGTLIISPVAHLPSLRRMGIEADRVVSVGAFTEGQRRFLDFHLNSVLLRAAR